MSKIVVVMTCHNRREKTTGCLVKLHDGNNNNEYHYIVVDAGSTDGTCDEIEKQDIGMLNLSMRSRPCSGTAGCTAELKSE